MAKQHYFGRRETQRIVRAVRWVESQRPDERRAVGPHRGTPDFISVYNNSSAVIPPYSLVRVEDTSSVRTTPATVSVVKPDTTFSRDYLVTAGLEIPAESYGLAQRGDYVLIACDSLYAEGAGVGPKPADWEANQYYPVLADLVAYDTDASERTGLNVFLARWRPMDALLVATTSSISAGGSATVQVRQASSSTGVNVSGWTVPVVNLFDAITASESTPKPMLAHWDSGRWYVPPMGGSGQTVAFGSVGGAPSIGTAFVDSTALRTVLFSTSYNGPSTGITYNATAGYIQVDQAGWYRYSGHLDLILGIPTTITPSIEGFAYGTINSTQIFASTRGLVHTAFEYVVRDPAVGAEAIHFVPLVGFFYSSGGDQVGMGYRFSQTSTLVEYNLSNGTQFTLERIGG